VKRATDRKMALASLCTWGCFLLFVPSILYSPDTRKRRWRYILGESTLA